MVDTMTGVGRMGDTMTEVGRMVDTRAVRKRQGIGTKMIISNETKTIIHGQFNFHVTTLLLYETKTLIHRQLNSLINNVHRCNLNQQ